MRRLGLIWLAGVAVGLAAEWVGFGWGDPRHWIADLAVGWSFIGCGLVAARPRSESRSGLLMAATGFTWFVGNFAQVGVAAVAWLAAHTVYLHRGPLVHLVLTYPSGRSGSRLVRGAVVVGYVVAVTPIWRSAGATIVMAVLLLAVCARDYIRAVGRARRARRIALQATAGLSSVLRPPRRLACCCRRRRSAVPRCVCTSWRCAFLPAVYWRVCWWPRGSGRPSPTWSWSSARQGRAHFAESWLGRLATHPLRSATGARTERCSSTPTAARSPRPSSVRAAR